MRGFHAASIEEIAAAAEYATGTVYLYFRDKEALYLELFEGKIRELGRCIRERIARVRDPIEAIRRLIEARMEFFQRNSAFFRIYAREGMNRYEARHDRWARVMRLYAEYLQLLAGLIAKGQRHGLLRKGDSRRLAVALSGMMIELTRHKLQSRRAGPLTDLAPFVFELFLNGVSAKPRR